MSKEGFEDWAKGYGFPLNGLGTRCARIGWQAGIEYITSRPTTNTRLDKDEFKKDDPQTLVDRLRGLYLVPVPGQYRTAPVQHEAAREIERLRKDAERYRYLRENIGGLQSMRPYHAPKPDALDAALTDAQK